MVLAGGLVFVGWGGKWYGFQLVVGVGVGLLN